LNLNSNAKQLNTYYKNKLISYNVHGFSYSRDPEIRQVIESIKFLAIQRSFDKTQFTMKVSFKINEKTFIETIEIKPIVVQNENNEHLQRPRFLTLHLYNQKETFNKKLEVLGVKDKFHEIEDWFEEIKISSFLRKLPIL
jgi:hypothetical protein